MIKILDSTKNNFYFLLDRLLLKRKNKIQFNSKEVKKIIEDVRKNGDRAVLKYEKKYSKNSRIVPDPISIKKAILKLDPKVIITRVEPSSTSKFTARDIRTYFIC